MQMGGGWEGIKVDRCMEMFCGLPSKSIKEGTKKHTKERYNRCTLQVHLKLQRNADGGKKI